MLKGDTHQSGPAVGIALLAGALFLSAGMFVHTDSVSHHKFQLVLISVNVCNLISTVYGIYMNGCVSVSIPPVREVLTTREYKPIDCFPTKISGY
jgi:hypothetical protein